MRKMKKSFMASLLTIVMAISLVGCKAEFDAANYVDSCLDLLTKGETKEYMKMTKRTEEQAKQDYQNNLDAMVTSMGVTGISDKLQEDYKTFFKELYSKSKYEVKSSKKMSGKDGYTVTVEIQQITGLFDGLQDELVEKSADLASEDLDLNEAMEAVFQLMLDLMNDRLDNITYSDAKSITVDVVADSDKVYSITDKGYEAINDALISIEGLETE